MISEILEIIGFSLGLLVALYLWKFHKEQKPSPIVIEPPPSIALSEDVLKLPEEKFQFEEE